MSNESPLMVSAKKSAEMFGLSRSTWDRHTLTGKVPKPVRIGRRVLWHLPELIEWGRAGCPDRRTWDAMKRKGG